MGIKAIEFGRFWNTPVKGLILTNKNGMEVEVLNYGAIVRRLVVPGKNGPDDVVLGFDTLAEYLYGHPFFGAVAGRVANRINSGRFSLNGKQYTLAANEASTGQHLHGGMRGFDKYVWDAETVDGVARVVLRRVSAAGEEGYPGELAVEHVIELDEDNGLTLQFKATATTEDTVVNLVNHGYYNLRGHQTGNAAPHTLRIHAEAVTPVNGVMIPTGEMKPVAETPCDFRSAVSLEQRMSQQPDALFDINFVLDRKTPAEGDLFAAVSLHDPASNRTMNVATNLPGVQFYNGAKLNMRPWVGKGGAAYGAFSGLCFETQFFPDAPNQPAFPSITLGKGQTRLNRTVHRFSW